jgi:hypothetical protein
MKRGSAGFAALLAVWVGAGSAAASERAWRVEAGLGAAHSFGSTLTVEQAGFAPVEIDAGWEARALESPVCYAWRVSRRSGGRAWALRLVHHKAYLANPTPEVTRFSVSHGYNLLTAKRGWARGGFWIWAGLGLVVAHPESTIRGQTRAEDQGGPFGGGYFLTGPAGAVAVSRPIALGDRFGLVLEARASLARARVPVADGSADVPNASVHALVGVDFAF